MNKQSHVPKTPEQPKKKKVRADVFTRVYFDINTKRCDIGSICEVTDADELERLTELGVIKSKFIEV